MAHSNVCDVGRNLNAFRFNVIDNDSIENWLRLYAAAIRCSIQPCERGFVFVTWLFMGNGNVVGRHATALYFDVARKTQVFIDPSGCLEYTEHGNVLKHFREFHVWVSEAEKPHVSTTRTGPNPWSGSLVDTDNTAVLSRSNRGAAKDSGYQRMLHHHGCAGGLDVLAFRMPGSSSNGEEYPLRDGQQAWHRVCPNGNAPEGQRDYGVPPPSASVAKRNYEPRHE